MKSYAFLIVLTILANLLYAQNHDAYWYFGYGSLIAFSDSEITCSESYLSLSNESSIVFSNSNGDLLFYGNGKYLYNFDNSYVSNSDLEINDHYWDTSYVTGFIQSSIVFPIGTDDKRAIIINNTSEAGEGSFKGLAFSIYNSELEMGYGNIESDNRNIHFLDDYIGHAIAGIKHGNGKDWWLITHQCRLWYDTTNTFIKYRIQNDTIFGPFYQSVGLLNNRGLNWTQMIFNNDGDKLVYYGDNNFLEIFNFNRCTGELSEWINFDDNYLTYGKAFSPDGSKLYISKYQSGKIYQYDLTAGETGDEIKASRQLVYNCPDDEHYIGSMALGPDDKIYFTTYYPYGPETPATEFNTYLNVIHNPNASGDSCHVEDRAIWLCEGIAQIGLPNMPNYRLGALQGSECDTLNTAIQESTIQKTFFTVYPNPATDYLYVETSTQEQLNLIIRDVKGSVCMQINRLNDTPIDINHLPVGMYSVIAIGMQSGKVYNDKFIKMK